MNEMIAKVTIPRINPEKDAGSQIITYEVPYTKGMRLAEALRYIFEKLDGTIAFRNNFCKRGSCSLCLVLMNKKPVKACKQEIKPEMLIEPVPQLPLIKDLAVDFNRREHDSVGGSSSD